MEGGGFGCLRSTWEKLLEEFERNGISGPQFAAVVGVKYQILAGEARKRRQRGQAKVTSEFAARLLWRPVPLTAGGLTDDELRAPGRSR